MKTFRREAALLASSWLVVTAGPAGCGGGAAPSGRALEALAPRDQADSLAVWIAANVRALDLVVTIDHSRLADAEGVSMPPSLVTIYSDPAVNSALVAIDPRIGIDLPHRVLAYVEADSGTARVTYADAEFLMKRHGLTDAALLDGYTRSLQEALGGIPPERWAPDDASRLEKGYGITEIVSAFPFEATIERLREAVLAQSDTKWFGEVDYRADAAALGLEVPKATLLLFGGPGPGGRAMAEFPRLGLDAFCQKLLVYEDATGSVRVAFNDIAALAEFHYGRSIPIHKGLNERLAQTFFAAVSGEGT